MNKPLLLLIGGLIVGLIIVASLSYQYYENKQLSARLDTELMTANLELGRAKTEYGNANKYIKELEEAIQKEIKEKEAALTLAAKFEASLRIVQAATGSTKIVYLPGEHIVSDRLELKPNLLYRSLSTNELVPVDSLEFTHLDTRLKIAVLIDAASLESKITYELLSSIRGTFVQAISSTGTPSHYLVLHEVGSDGKDLRRLTLTSFTTTIVDERKAEWIWWNPYIDIGAIAALTFPLSLSGYGAIGLSIASYGATDMPDWRFLRIGLAMNRGLAFTVAPALFNIGKPIVLFRNLWLGPEFVYNLDGRMGLGIFFGATL
jgi:hypothetical protein